jgi:hypothetical protein
MQEQQEAMRILAVVYRSHPARSPGLRDALAATRK